MSTQAAYRHLDYQPPGKASAVRNDAAASRSRHRRNRVAHSREGDVIPQAIVSWPVFHTNNREYQGLIYSIPMTAFSA